MNLCYYQMIILHVRIHVINIDSCIPFELSVVVMFVFAICHTKSYIRIFDLACHILLVFTSDNRGA